jgi:hypothetical protein
VGAGALIFVALAILIAIIEAKARRRSARERATGTPVQMD